MALDTASEGNFTTRNPLEALDVVHELLRKQVCSAEGEVADTEGEENVNYIGVTGF
ncbi:unnamed protein product [Brassica rapa subsp. trilocularis]